MHVDPHHTPRRPVRPPGRGRRPHPAGRVRRPPLAVGGLRPAAPARVRAAAAAAPAPRGRPGRPGPLQKNLPARVAEVAAARPGQRVEVWFEDEARFGQKGTLTAVWAAKGTRPSAPKQTAYGNLHVLTAACPATGRAAALVSERLNAAVVAA